jgi:predicted nuclease of predicted toxin-antitoxin system
MRVLLDECLPIDFRHSLPGHEVYTAQWAGMKGKKNGDLLDAAELAGYDVLLTVDQGISYQQNLAKRRISIIQICSRTNQIEDLTVYCHEILASLRAIQSGEVARIGA